MSSTKCRTRMMFKGSLVAVALVVLFLGAATSSTLAAGNLTDSATIADLIYNPLTGNVKLDATEAQTGGAITTFQLENFDASFVPDNYITITSGAFGGFFQDVTTSVIGDTDFSFVGFSGVQDIGNVFPTGIASAVALQDYLKTAGYTGSLGSDQQQFDLIIDAGEIIPAPAAVSAGLVMLGYVIARRRR